MPHSPYRDRVIPPLTSRVPYLAVPFLAATALLFVLASCAPSPQPTATPTPLYSTKKEAFAAAEGVYRAYNDAGNARRNGDKAAKPQLFLRGEALEAELAADDYFRSNGLKLVGEVKVSSFAGLHAELTPARTSLTALVCLDVSGVRLLNQDGTDVTSAERPATVAQSIEMSADVNDLLIDHEEEATADQCSDQ